MPQNDIVLPVNPPKRKNPYYLQKVGKQVIQGNFNLSKSGHNWLEVTEDEVLEIKGVTSLEIHNLGDEEVVINGFPLLPLPHSDSLLNKPIEGITDLWDLIDRASKETLKFLFLPDGTYSDITLNINFLGTEVNMVRTNSLLSVPFASPDYTGWVNNSLPYLILLPIGDFVKVIYKVFKSVDSQSPILSMEVRESINPCVLGANDNIVLNNMPIVTVSDPNDTFMRGAVIQFQRLDTLEFSEEFPLNFIK